MDNEYEELKRARYALLVDAELALCNGLNKEEWKLIMEGTASR